MSEHNRDKRRHKRIDVDSVHGRMTYASDINILNISLDGAAIVTTQRLVIDRVYSLRIKYENCDMTLKGKVVWSVLSHSKTLQNGEVVPVYKAGMRFTNTLTDTARQIISYIEKNRQNPLEKRILGVRFKIHQTEGAEIDCPFQYQIKKISLTGMLIEAESPLTEDSRHVMEISLDGVPLTVNGRIANLTEKTSGDVVKYEAGIEFLEMSEENRKVLQAFIESKEKEV